MPLNSLKLYIQKKRPKVRDELSSDSYPSHIELIFYFSAIFNSFIINFAKVNIMIDFHWIELNSRFNYLWKKLASRDQIGPYPRFSLRRNFKQFKCRPLDTTSVKNFIFRGCANVCVCVCVSELFLWSLKCLS